MSNRSVTSSLSDHPVPWCPAEPSHTLAQPPHTPAAARARASISGEGVNVEIAALAGQVGDGVDASVLAGSILWNAEQATLQAKMFDMQVASRDGRWTGSVENLSTRLSVGTQNPDGSVGVNVGAAATVVGVEGTFSHSGWSVTVGVGAGAGNEVSLGIRDQDRDGEPELCGRGGVGALTIGLCAEILQPDEPGRTRWEGLP
jgi:hypothetical protein